MKLLTKNLILSLMACSFVTFAGCAEDNEKSSGVAATGTSTEGAGQTRPMTQEEYAKKHSGAVPSNYPGAKKFVKSGPDAASKGGTPAATK